ncbi:hypothetical protein C806_00364 [Lachnospiraceae bacterium 3-1]|nr:hypothetical protein C806_00364 [Lachnospiraceae bacterium 3-1]
MVWAIVLREKEMKRKLSTDIFLMQCLFLMIIMGISILLYTIFMPAYYERVKNKQIVQAYDDIGELDLSDLEERDYVLFANYESENLSFYIADENFKPVYTTGLNEKEEKAIQRNIVRKVDLFSREPQIIRSTGKLSETVKYRGIMRQDDKDYYIVIKDIIAGRKSITLAEKFYLVLFFSLMIPGSIFMALLWQHRMKPFHNLILTADQAADGNFSEKIQEKGRYEEINQLAVCINKMSQQLEEQSCQIEENKKYRMHHNVKEDQREKRRKELIANVSHELKTPLAVIASQAEMLGYVKEDQEYYIASIQEEVAKMSDMVSRLLDNSVMEHQMENMIQKTFDMKEVMDYILIKYEAMVKKKRIHMETFLSEHCYVEGDREYIEQVVNNYMTNALGHTDIGGNIRMTLKRQEKLIRVGIYNEGRQIPKEDMDHIWSGYYRNKKEPRQEENGFSHAGLGLYIVQSVVTMHNGNYGVENLSSGVEFWFTLPEAEFNPQFE